jgi:hypothetical protein
MAENGRQNECTPVRNNNVREHNRQGVRDQNIAEERQLVNGNNAKTHEQQNGTRGNAR